MKNTEPHAPPTSAVFSPAHGWEIIAQLLIRIAAAFGAHGALARRTLRAETARALLGWLRPAEELARKLLYVMALAVKPPPREGRGWGAGRNAVVRHLDSDSNFQTSSLSSPPAPSPTDRQPRSALEDAGSPGDPEGEGFEPGAWRVSFAMFKRAPSETTPRTARGHRRRSILDDEDDCFRDREAERAARDARVGGGVQPLWLRDWRDKPRAAPPPPAPAPERNLAASLARRIEALVRLIADPERWALKLARRLHAASHEVRAALVAPFHKPHERTRRTPCPAGLSLTDRLIAEAACDTS